MTTYDEHYTRHLERITRLTGRGGGRTQQLRRPELDAAVTRYRIATGVSSILFFVMLIATGVAEHTGAIGEWVVVPAFVFSVTTFFCGLVFVGACSNDQDGKVPVGGRFVPRSGSVPGPVATAYKEAAAAIDRLPDNQVATELRATADRILTLAMNAVEIGGVQATALHDLATEMTKTAAASCALSEVFSDDLVQNTISQMQTDDARELAATVAALHERMASSDVKELR